MAFLDKITDVASTITDKAGDAVEVTKLKTKISGEKKEVEAMMAQIGRIYYEKAKAGEELEVEAMDLVNKVDAKYEVIDELEMKIRNISL